MPCEESEVDAASDFIKNAPGDFIRKSGLWCLQKIDEDMELKGHYHTDYFFYLKVVFELCPVYGPQEGIECASLEELEDYIDQLIINVAIFKPNFKVGESL